MADTDVQDPQEQQKKKPLSQLLAQGAPAPAQTDDGQDDGGDGEDNTDQAPTLPAKPSASTTAPASGGFDPKNYLPTPPSEAEARTALNGLSELKRQTVDPADLDYLDKAEDEAKKLYQDRASRADWLGVAEKIGNAMVKLGAANKGLGLGVDLSQAANVPLTDWESKIARYGKEYQTELGRLGTQRERDLAAQQRQQGLANQDYQDQRQTLEDHLKFAENKYGTDSREYNASLRDLINLQRTQAYAGAQENRADSRAQVQSELADKREQAHEDRQNKSIQARQLSDELRQAQDEYSNAVSAATVLNQQDDLSKKTLDNLEQKTPGMLGKAGISPADLAAVDAKATVPGRLWGSNVDPQMKKDLIDKQILQPKAQRIQTLRDALNRLSSGSSSSGQQAPQPVQSSSQGPTDEQLDKYVSMYPTVSREQARDILSKRLQGK